jgi:hypothetical protein
MTMSDSPRISGEAFAVEKLRENPDLDYSDIRRMATEAGVSLAPIQYGRARRQLGLPPLRGPRAVPAATRPGIGQPAPMSGTAEPSDAPDDSDAADSSDDDNDGGDMAAPMVASDRADDIVAPKRKGSPAFDFLVRALQQEPHVSYGELKRRADDMGHRIAPIMYGRAKAKLGLVPVKPRGQGKRAAATAAAATPSAPRVLRQVESVAADRFAQKLEEVRNVEQLVTIVKDLDAERRRLRQVLDRIVALIDEALG